MTPKDALEAKKMINTAFIHFNAPYILRFPKGNVENQECSLDETIEIGTWEKVIFQPFHSLTVITYDQKVDQVFHLIQEYHLPVNLINARFIKPLDKDMLNELYTTHQHIIVYETDILTGSLGSQIAHYYSRLHMNMSIDYLGIDDHYTPQGNIEKLLEIEMVSLDHLLNLIKEKLDEKRES